MGWWFIAWIGLTLIAGVAIGVLMQPDIPSPGEPDNELSVPQIKEGAPLYDILGTTKIASGTFLFYYNNHSIAIKEKVKTGFFSSKRVVVGYDYYLTWGYGLCLGPVDVLYTIYMDDDVVWSGELTRPVSGGEKTIFLYADGANEDSWFSSMLAALIERIGGIPNPFNCIGTLTFYFGTNDQAPNAQITSDMAAGLTSMPFNLAYRNMCWAYFYNFKIGGFNRCPNFKFVIHKKPSQSFDP
jgi:hypothetical protein